MVQILQPLPSTRTLRQQAFDESMGQIGQGIAGFAQAQDQRTQREQALQGDILKTTAALRESGYDVTPDQVAEQMKPKTSKGILSSLFGSNEEESDTIEPKQDIFAKRTAEYKSKENDKSLQRQKTQLEINALMNPSEAEKFKTLPEDKKNTITTLATDNAKKASAINYIQAELDKWDSYTDEQKLTQGRQLIKPLNSVMGQDAVGAEEVKRLAANLEFAKGNFTNDNPIYFGRNLDGFKQQVQDTLNSMKTMVSQNQKLVDEAYGRKTPIRPENRKTESKRFFNAAKNKTKIVYSDGSEEIIDGQ